MAPSYPPKKFAPTPIEQTTRSSRQTPEEGETTPKARRIAPEPVEHSVKSSKDAKSAVEEKPKARRFAPEPVEHSAKSSKDVRNGQSSQEEKPKPRRFAPQMVEETVKSSKDQKAEKGHVKFKPEPIATTYGTNRKAKQEENGEDAKPGPRKFAPILLDTAKRSRRATDRGPALSQNDKTEAGFQIHARELRRHITGEVTPAPGSAVGSEDDDSQSEYSLSPTQERIGRDGPRRRSISPMDGSPGPRASCFSPHRQHSYHMPDLDTIESSESERPSPRSASPNVAVEDGSPITAPASGDSFEFYKHATRIRESVDENFTHYLLEVERKKAQKRLEEQALAAYPNPDFGYEAPRHYGFNDEDESSEDMEIEERPVTWEGHEDDLVEMARRESTAKGNWEQMEMQRHAEDLKQERNANQVTAKQTTERSSPWWNPTAALQKEQEADKEMRSMRDRARPPMLGTDIVFPRCPSPEPARFDVTQGPATLRNQMCYLTQSAEYERQRSGEEGGLWRGVNAAAQSGGKRKGSATPTSPSSPKKSDSAAKGLWGGFCVDSESPSKANAGGLAPPVHATGLLTPKPETASQGNPFDDLSFAAPKTGPAGGVTTPPSRPSSATGAGKDPDLNRIDSVLSAEKELDKVMEAEFPDAFITQVYNYLSLGYPSLARPFDEELAKISRFSMAELRSDDVKARKSPRGYIRLGPDFEGGGGEVVVGEEECMRWRALKRYIREWARQERVGGDSGWGEDKGGNWGTGARRGSWAI